MIHFILALWPLWFALLACAAVALFRLDTPIPPTSD